MMNFNHSCGSLFITGTTSKGASISFTPIIDNNLKFFDARLFPNCSLEDRFKIPIRVKYDPAPTRIVFYCNTEFSIGMLEELEKSKILYVTELNNGGIQFICHPLFGFTQEKLMNVLDYTMSKFNK